MKKLLKILSLLILLNSQASFALPKFFNRKVLGGLTKGSLITFMIYAHRDKLTELSDQKTKPQFEIQSFDPNNKKQYEQVLNLLTNEKEFLLDPQEDPAQTMKKYVDGMKTANIRTRKNPYAGLMCKVMLTKNNSDVIGFITFVPAI